MGTKEKRKINIAITALMFMIVFIVGIGIMYFGMQLSWRERFIVLAYVIGIAIVRSLYIVAVYADNKLKGD